ncbi:hypothetical protein LEP1GSC124_1404 [Leptospira interrogans serovar Pyrogenes str. 200701872]|uniref:Uncharacterized protein n=2 Tax=Leptospira interrogans TaxID=173 RepID=M6ZS76_LEPIR|nr:hypothetical protein LEP1GSC150_0721 [Leptospira interrogans serovar Copenhageni str. LT2050]EMP07082.1 hypothetical protein LEP1GSC124_1404 [Leptospira interrogans serovar Pyrogenes str. 200701872]
MTLPITLGIGYAIAANARVPGYHKFQKTFGGSIFILLSEPVLLLQTPGTI